MAVPPQTNTMDRFIQVRARHGNDTLQNVNYPVATSQTIYAGDILALTGYTVQQALTLAASNNTAVNSGGNTAIVGIADDSITTDSNGVATDGSGNTTLNVTIFNDNCDILMRIYSATTTSSTQSGVTAGTSYQFCRYRLASSTQWVYALITTTTNGEFRMYERSIISASTDNYGVVIVRPILSDTVRQA